MESGSPSTPTLPAEVRPPPAAEPDLSGRTFGDFELVRRLGEGGMGQVYLARQVSLNRKVAFKILRSELASNPASLKRFQAEAEAVARVNHANIVGVYAIGQQDGLHYMALEFVDGWNLREYVERKGPPELPVALGIMRQVAAALQRAAELGIIQRDIKPENILLTRKGEVKVADFGLSRCFAGDGPALNLTQSGVALGTPLYMSPEQVQGKELDPRTDVYSFGVTCYTMLTGTPPFRGQTAFEVALQHVQAAPRPLGEVRPDLPVPLCAIVARMMAKDPGARYQTGREILQDLAALRGSLSGTLVLSGGRPVVTATATSERPGRRWNWLPWAFAASLAGALAAGAALGWRPAPSNASPVEPEAAGVAFKETPVDRKWEKILAEEVRRTANPAKDRDQLLHGLDARLDLGLVYLDEGRLGEAIRFFDEQISEPNRVGPYRMLGKLGQAVVLAFQDRAAESNQVFLEIFGDHVPRVGEKRVKAMVLNRNPRFHMRVAEALGRNEANHQTLTPELQELRKPQPLPVPRPNNNNTTKTEPEKKR